MNTHSLFSRVLLFLFLIQFASFSFAQPSLYGCNKAFDVFFILDGTPSIGSAGKTAEIQFVQQMSVKFTHPETRVGVTVFRADTTGQLLMPLQTDSPARKTALANLNFVLQDGTTIGCGINQANMELERKRATDTYIRPAVYFVLTDGNESPEDQFPLPTLGVARANEAKALGDVEIFCLGVGDIDFNYLKAMASTPTSEYVYTPATFNDLSADKFFSIISGGGCLSLNHTSGLCPFECKDVTATTPFPPATNSQAAKEPLINVYGTAFLSGFSTNQAGEKLLCVLRDVRTNGIWTLNALVMSDTVLSCYTEYCQNKNITTLNKNNTNANIVQPGEYELSFRMMQYANIEWELATNQTVTITACAVIHGGATPIPFFFYLLPLLLIPLLLLAYFLLRKKKKPVEEKPQPAPAIVAAVPPPPPVKQKKVAPPPLPVVVPPPPEIVVEQMEEAVAVVPPAGPGQKVKGKWAQVDTSKYIWARDGGTARPLSCDWGALGPTCAAAHLDGVVAVLDKDLGPQQPPELPAEEAKADAAFDGAQAQQDMNPLPRRPPPGPPPRPSKNVPATAPPATPKEEGWFSSFGSFFRHLGKAIKKMFCCGCC